ncbi:PLP-dependent transferase [Coprinopsis marcescibilis]|uniref:cystathionine gamma-synthase n=1 Tax=Coprinopsis marcescibilis TaxID=230819 RepID=A0A5C3L0N6_COPMA|nr:PLP-dependent transferase [Coprinopsis marcescibilis]
MNTTLGSSIPPDTPHAISVSLPTWRDNVGYEEGDKRVVDRMVTGYPRFFIHLSIKKLSTICEQKYAVNNEQCMLFSTKKVAEECRSFIQRRSAILGHPAKARLVDLLICPEDDSDSAVPAPTANGALNGKPKPCPGSIGSTCAELHIVLFPGDAFPVAKEFWQHSGLGISSRFAEKCLSLLPDEVGARAARAAAAAAGERPVTPINQRNGVKFAGRRYNKHYAAVKGRSGGGTRPSSPPLSGSPCSPTFSGFSAALGDADEDLDKDHSVYLEERYGRNLPLSAAAFAKRALKRRVAGVLLCDVPDCQDTAGQEGLTVGPSTRGVQDASEDDVVLYPTGMTAIWNAHQLAMQVLGQEKSVCFGFPYTDTLKILQKWGPGCHFLGHGLDSDIDELEKILEKESAEKPGRRSIVGLFTEFPSNPLLRSANLPRLRQLADKYDFLIIIDETIGNLVNVKVIQYADIVVSSLTKIFSGASNVMGGSLMFNPKGRHYATLKQQLANSFEDLYFEEDAIYMERNSRDFRKRIHAIDKNAEAVCDLLQSRSQAGGYPNAAIKEVFYPKYVTAEHYEHCRVKSSASEDGRAGGYGGLFSLTFTSLAASSGFFDALPCHKGPSLGTNFTLACPFTILAHFTELDWAAEYGVEEGLVRISVGLEDTENLLRAFHTALKAAELKVSSGTS